MLFAGVERIQPWRRLPVSVGPRVARRLERREIFQYLRSIAHATAPTLVLFRTDGFNLKLQGQRSRLTRSAKRMRPGQGNNRGACEFEFRLSVGRAQVLRMQTYRRRSDVAIVAHCRPDLGRLR